MSTEIARKNNVFRGPICPKLVLTVIMITIPSDRWTETHETHRHRKRPYPGTLHGNNDKPYRFALALPRVPPATPAAATAGGAEPAAALAKRHASPAPAPAGVSKGRMVAAAARPPDPAHIAPSRVVAPALVLGAVVAVAVFGAVFSTAAAVSAESLDLGQPPHAGGNPARFDQSKT